MKISEMNLDQATEAMIRLSGAFSNICEDDNMLKVLDSFTAFQNPDDHEPLIRKVGRLIPMFVTFGLKDHKADLYEIVGALTCTPTGKVGLMNLKETINTIQGSYDEILAGFFTQSAEAMKKIVRESAVSSSGTDGTDFTP